MMIFHGYVSLPEGNMENHHLVSFPIKNDDFP